MKFTNKLQNAVKAFQEAFNHPVASEPQVISTKRGLNRSIWTGEEIVEFLHSISSDEFEFTELYDEFLNGMDRAYAKSMKEEFIKSNVMRITAMSDALADQLYFVFGTAVEIGIDIERIFDIVQESNMSKLFTDEEGNKYPKYREEDGKVMKSPEFFPPEGAILVEVMRQMNLDVDLIN